MNNTITISKEEYETLKDSAFKLECLKAGGVHNWIYYRESLVDGGYVGNKENSIKPNLSLDKPVAYLTSDGRMLVFADKVDEDDHGMTPLYAKPMIKGIRK